MCVLLTTNNCKCPSFDRYIIVQRDAFWGFRRKPKKGNPIGENSTSVRLYLRNYYWHQLEIWHNNRIFFPTNIRWNILTFIENGTRNGEAKFENEATNSCEISHEKDVAFTLKNYLYFSFKSHTLFSWGLKIQFHFIVVYWSKTWNNFLISSLLVSVDCHSTFLLSCCFCRSLILSLPVDMLIYIIFCFLINTLILPTLQVSLFQFFSYHSMFVSDSL